MPHTITIREYKTEDEKDVINLLRLNTPKYFAKEEEKDLREYLNSKIEHYYVLLYQQKLVGSGGINYSKDRKTAFISWDIIHPEYQNMSLGRQLMKHRIAKLNTVLTIKEIIVRTSQFAYKFYEKQGFKLNQIEIDYWAKGFHLYKMQYMRQMQ